ncbi:transcriptional regulator [Lampropedia cohaerens]|uniref:Transcriptional regulator n=1 Tax=Lampropedia cohaerens TaxID=1610491 RepID=A0A0U1PZX3_9BURK|nr:response regulator [Lampropedia cohaerens]KKW68037.1 transcriptional regulator [Lampropedia cohaerens]
MSNRSCILLVDDHPLMRRGIVELLASTDDFEVVAEASSGREAIKVACQLRPEMILLDQHMPGGLSGLQVLDELRQLALPIQAVILTAQLNRNEFLSALQLGVAGYILKDADPEMLLAHLRRCRHGEIALSEEMVALLAHPDESQSAPSAELLSTLTPREGQTLALIAQGLSNKEIAREIGISDSTVKVYVKSLLSKLNMRSRLELAVWVYKSTGMNPKDS